MDKPESQKLPGYLVLGVGSTLLWVLPPGALPVPHSEYQRKIPLCFQEKEEKRNHLKTYQSISFSTGPLSGETVWWEPNLLGFYPTWGKRKRQPQPLLDILNMRRGETGKHCWSSQSRNTVSTKDWDLIRVLPTPSHLTTTSPKAYSPVSFTQDIMSTFQQ